MTDRNAYRAAVAMAVMLTAALLAFAGCNRPTRDVALGPSRATGTSASDRAVRTEVLAPDERSLTAPIPVPPGEYVGSAQCAACHAQEFADQTASRHAATLRSLDMPSDRASFPPVGRIPDTPFHIAHGQDGYRLVVDSRPPVGQRLRYALGSGKSGITYVTPLADGYLFEARYSYFPKLKRWEVTPGQEEDDEGDLGVDRAGALARGCIECHSTYLARHSLNPDRKFFGVGCESCHGPGGAHVRARRTGAVATGQMEPLREWQPQKLNRLCGRCHRTVTGLTNQFERIQTHRFQPYALMKSACFVKSGGQLSCITCHSPHRDASTDLASYERVCLDCHSSITPTAPSKATAGKPCPVNPRTGCIGCHMPDRTAFLGTDLPVKMKDHLIAVYPPHR